MKESKMQILLLENLKENYGKSTVKEEYPLMHGTADIIVIKNGKMYCFELKETPTKKLFEQSLKHRLIANKMFCVATRPARQTTSDKWERYAESIGVNMIWHDQIKNFKLWKGKTNKKLNKNIRRISYDI